MITKICFCGKEFQTVPARIKDGRGKFCSKACGYEARRKNPKLQATCLYCGIEFYYTVKESEQRKGHLGKYCSFKHYNLHRKAQPKKCEYCKEPFMSYVKTRKYCNHSCATKHRAQTDPNFMNSLKRAWKANKVRKQSYKGMPKPPWLCTPEAEAKKNAARRGVPLLSMRGANHPNWKGGKASKNRVIRTSIEYKEWRRKVYERDDYACQMCGLRGQKGLGKTVRLEADHIKPFSTHPELRVDVNNGRTLCIDCHRDVTKQQIRKFHYCQVQDCENKHHARALCSKHLARAKRAMAGGENLQQAIIRLYPSLA